MKKIPFLVAGLLFAFLFQSHTLLEQATTPVAHKLTKQGERHVCPLHPAKMQLAPPSFDESCFTSYDEYAIYLASSTEKAALDLVFPIPTEVEEEVGQQFHDSEAQQYTFLEDKRTDKLRKIMKKMAKFASRNSELKYQLYLIEDPVINAWTVPGGNVYVTTGIYDAAKNDDELAIIIGHEIGHNEMRHGTRHIQRAAPAMWFGDQVAVIINVLSSLTIAFNQYQELESDQIGFDLARKAGYDPLKGLEFWVRMAEDEQPDFYEKFFRSHPYSINRYNCGKAYIESSK